MALAEENESYVKSAAERRLALIKSQLIQQTQEDSVIGRQLKTQKRKDLSSQLQPLDAQVQLKAGVSAGAPGKAPKAWGQIRGSSGMRPQSTAPLRTPQMNLPWRKQGPDSPGTTRYHTGRTTILDKAATWTTEGYIDKKEQPREQAKQMVIRSMKGDKGWIYDRVVNPMSGEREWQGKLMEFKSSGDLTPTAIVKEKQKDRGERILAERAAGTSPPDLAEGFKKRRQNMMASEHPDKMMSFYPEQMGVYHK